MKSFKQKLIIAALITPFLVACAGKGASLDKVSEGVDIGKNPFGAWKQAVDSAEKLNDLQEEISNRKPAEPVHFNQLIESLPKTSAGWSAEEAKGATNSFVGLGVSEASRQYTKDNQTIKVTVFDWAYNFGLYAPFTLSADFSQETSEGYNKGIKIGDIPGREEFNYQSKDGKLAVLLDQRFFVQIEGDNLENSQELFKWLNKVDRKSLSKLVQ